MIESLAGVLAAGAGLALLALDARREHVPQSDDTWSNRVTAHDLGNRWLPR